MAISVLLPIECGFNVLVNFFVPKKREIMKKILFSLLFIVSSSLCTTSFYNECCDNYDECCNLNNSCFIIALTSGYVFKHHDCNFKEVYGHGIPNIITLDGCYYPWESWGIGTKISYWRTKGKTTILKNRTHLQEEPLTFYLRKTTNCWCDLQAYASLGGGVIFIQEKSYLGHVRRYKGIGEFEVGLNYPVWRCFNITGAFRYLFPREFVCHQKSDVGGFDLRAGIGYSY